MRKETMTFPRGIWLTLVVLACATTALEGLAVEPVETIWPSSGAAAVYGYDGSGNIVSAGTDRFVYDSFGRLTHAGIEVSGAGRTQDYGYDVYGNLTSITTTAGGAEETRSFTVGPTTNRVSSMTITGGPADGTTGSYTYNGRGSMTVNGSATYAWDSLDRIERSQESGRDLRFVYTADGERIGIRNASSGTWTWTVRDLGGKVLREFSRNGTVIEWKKDYVYRDGQLLARITPNGTNETVEYFHLDHLGTPRLITKGGFAVSYHTYYPFGTEATAETSASPSERMRFTGHERDYGTAVNSPYTLDYMHARYYSPVGSRFLSTDPHWDIPRFCRQPQMWNRYSYVQNSPVIYADPTGEVVWIFTGKGAETKRTFAALKLALNNPEAAHFGCTSDFLADQVRA